MPKWLRFLALASVMALIAGSGAASAGPPAETGGTTTEAVVAVAPQVVAVAAQTADDDCDVLVDHGEKLKCKNQKLVAEVCETAELAATEDVGLFTTTQKAEFQTSCELATSLAAATEPESYKSVGLRRSAGGLTLAYTGEDRSCEDPDDPTCLGKGYLSDDDGDGICKRTGKDEGITVEAAAAADDKKIEDHGSKPTSEYKEWCAEVIGDGIGDDDGFCEFQGKGKTKYLEPCAQVETTDAVDAQDENFDEDKLVAVEAAIDGMTTSLDTANAALSSGIAELAAVKSVNITTASDPAQCLGMLSTEQGAERWPFWALEVQMGLAVAASGLYDACTPIAQQDVAGFNGSAACVAPAIAKAVNDGIWQGIELLDDAMTGGRVDNAMQCLEHLGVEIAGIADGVDEANAKLDDVLFNQQNLLELRRLSLQVIEIKEKTEFLVTATDAGRPVSNLELVSLQVSKGNVVAFKDVDLPPVVWEELSSPAGTYRLVIELPAGAKNAELYALEVAHEGPAVTHHGSVLFDRSGNTIICTGQ